MQRIKPEVMSPAGYWPQLHAAIEAGADAVYFGLNHFSARAKVGFTLGELPDVMRELHRRGVRGYLTFNTLVFDHELPEAARTLAAIAEAGTDAIIVQDLAVAQLARQIAPALEVHGSTQMSITSAEGVALAQRFGVARVVLARELSLDDIRAIRAASDCALELFVHGALCVSYSGQCFSSEAWGGRSANRGQCAQACRLPYELLVDGRLRPLGDARYLLSPGDLYALRQLPEIVKIGIASLKIEGRYKDADYVALTTHAYRQAVDEAWAGLPLSISDADELQLEQVYSRGLGPSFISGVNHQAVVRGRAPRHRGLLMGRVIGVLPERIIIVPEPRVAATPLKPGDGVVFDAADWRSPEEREEGGRLYQVSPLRDGSVELRFANGAISSARIRPGDLLWRSHDPNLDRVARPFTQATAPLSRQPLSLHVTAHEGKPLAIEWALAARPDLRVTVRSELPLGPAQSRALSADYLREQLGRLGGSPYALADLTLDLAGNPFAPSSLLNQLRRQAVALLSERQAQPMIMPVYDPQQALDTLLAQTADRRPQTADSGQQTADSGQQTADSRQWTADSRRQTADGRPQTADSGQRTADGRPQTADSRRQTAQLHLLVRTPEQLDASLELRPASITLDYLELYGLRPAVERIHEHGIAARVASPRILKPSEQRVVRFLLKLGCAILVRSGGLLESLQEEQHPELIGDFSLNTANIVSAEAFLKLGLSRLTPTHDLNAAQVADLARGLGPGQVEVVAYQHLPVFHTEHCVFCRFLSNGTSYKDCGHPCEQHRLALRDSSGRAHPVLADVGCRNTVFGAEAQEASRHLDDLRAAGVQHFRLEFAHETAAQVRLVAGAFAAALHGTITARELGQRLREAAPQGATEGSLFVPDDYLAVPLMQ